MSNQNTVAGVYNLPQMNFNGSTTSEFGLMVPGSAPPTNITWTSPYYETSLPNNGPNPFSSYPSPQFPVNSGLSISPPPDILGASLDGRPFKIRICGTIINGGGGNVTLKLYQVPLAGVGVISATGSVTTAGAPGSSDVTVSSLTLTAPTNPSAFLAEYVLLWDSTSKLINGYTSGVYDDAGTLTVLAPTVISGAPSSISSYTALNFMPSFKFGTGGVNAITVQEFSIDRV